MDGAEYIYWQLVQSYRTERGPRTRVVAYLGDKVMEEMAGIKMVDVVMPTRNGVELRRRCISQPTKAQTILLDRLKLRLPVTSGVHKT